MDDVDAVVGALRRPLAREASCDESVAEIHRSVGDSAGAYRAVPGMRACDAVVHAVLAGGPSSPTFDVLVALVAGSADPAASVARLARCGPQACTHLVRKFESHPLRDTFVAAVVRADACEHLTLPAWRSFARTASGPLPRPCLLDRMEDDDDCDGEDVPPCVFELISASAPAGSVVKEARRRLSSWVSLVPVCERAALLASNVHRCQQPALHGHVREALEVDIRERARLSADDTFVLAHLPANDLLHQWVNSAGTGPSAFLVAFHYAYAGDPGPIADRADLLLRFVDLAGQPHLTERVVAVALIATLADVLQQSTRPMASILFRTGSMPGQLADRRRSLLIATLFIMGRRASIMPTFAVDRVVEALLSGDVDHQSGDLVVRCALRLCHVDHPFCVSAALDALSLPGAVAILQRTATADLIDTVLAATDIRCNLEGDDGDDGRDADCPVPSIQRQASQVAAMLEPSLGTAVSLLVQVDDGADHDAFRDRLWAALHDVVQSRCRPDRDLLDAARQLFALTSCVDCGPSGCLRRRLPSPCTRAPPAKTFMAGLAPRSAWSLMQRGLQVVFGQEGVPESVLTLFAGDLNVVAGACIKYVQGMMDEESAVMAFVDVLIGKLISSASADGYVTAHAELCHLLFEVKEGRPETTLRALEHPALLSALVDTIQTSTSRRLAANTAILVTVFIGDLVEGLVGDADTRRRLLRRILQTSAVAGSCHQIVSACSTTVPFDNADDILKALLDCVVVISQVDVPGAAASVFGKAGEGEPVACRILDAFASAPGPIRVLFADGTSSDLLEMARGLIVAGCQNKQVKFSTTLARSDAFATRMLFLCRDFRRPAMHADLAFLGKMFACDGVLARTATAVPHITDWLSSYARDDPNAARYDSIINAIRERIR
ncbi:unnamed protein product (mitochondrion) [Plasmodiophora brassicae]|uniref:Uncharacterized protein n=1 Tax=Plasmodiophora brassicae TaxID=37360 RepID=A0A3P3YBD0_PLABS|nr:unnamed protein product [Plasmodiophora brassicae]